MIIYIQVHTTPDIVEAFYQDSLPLSFLPTVSLEKNCHMNNHSLGGHDDDAYLLLYNQSPHVFSSVIQRPLCTDVCFVVVEAVNIVSVDVVGLVWVFTLQYYT